MKIVINVRHGGFGLSDRAVMKYAALKGFSDSSSVSKIERNDPCLIEVVESLGNDANGNFASLKVVEIPDDVQWEIEEYDGDEWVSEKHRTWA